MNQQLAKQTAEWIFICVQNGKKYPQGVTHKWTKELALINMEMEQFNGETCIGPARVLKLKGVICLDIDETGITYQQVIELYPFLKGHLYTKGNTKGFHFYVKTKTDHKKKIDCFDRCKGDLIADQMFETEKEWFGTLQELEDTHIISMLKTEKDYSILTSTNKFDPFYRSILDNIDPILYTNYDDWKKFIGALNHFDNGLDIADEYSKKLHNYVSKQDVKKHMNYKTCLGYLINLSKKSNPLQYKIIIGKRFLYCHCFTEYDLSQIALYLIDDIIKVHDTLYNYQTYWLQDTSKGEGSIRKKLMDVLRSFFKLHLTRILDDLKNYEPEQEKYKELKRLSTRYEGVITNMIHKSGGSKAILDMYRIHLPESSIEFDKNPYLFCFQNCAFDLRNNLPYTVLKEDYITQFVPYDYVQSTPEQIQEMKTLFETILPESDVLQCYLSILRTCMIGICFEYFIMLNGSGGNGKGLTMDLFSAMASIYCYKGKVSTLLQEIKGGADPELANMDKKRCTRFAEIPDDAVLNLGTLKDITGGGEINARKCYSNETQVKLENTTIFECNKKPALNGRIDDSILRRFLTLHFKNQFTTNPEKLKLPNYKQGNPHYKTNEWKNTYKTVLFDYLLNVPYIDVVVPPSVRQTTMEYLMEADTLSNFMSEHFEITDSDDDLISLRDMTELYRDKMFKVNSRNHRNFTSKTMYDLLHQNAIWKVYVDKYFKERCRKNGVDKVKVFLGIKGVMIDEEVLI